MRKRVGEFLVEKEILSPAQVEEILAYSRKSGLRFGDAGVKLNILKRETLARVFGPGRADFFYLDPAYYPEKNKKVLPIDMILKHGVLPLGFKIERRLFSAKKFLNLGFLDPETPGAGEEILTYVREFSGMKDIDGIRVFLIISDQFLEILKTAFGVRPEDLVAKTPGTIHPRLLK